MPLYCYCVNNITGTTDDTDDRENGAMLTGRKAANTPPLKQHVRKNETPFMAATPTTGGMTDAACIYMVSSNLFPLRSIKKKREKS